jgi:hypothetical protein
MIPARAHFVNVHGGGVTIAASSLDAAEAELLRFASKKAPKSMRPGGRSSLLTRIAMMENVSLCVRMKS